MQFPSFLSYYTVKSSTVKLAHRSNQASAVTARLVWCTHVETTRALLLHNCTCYNNNKHMCDEFDNSLCIVVRHTILFLYYSILQLYYLLCVFIYLFVCTVFHSESKWNWKWNGTWKWKYDTHNCAIYFSTPSMSCSNTPRNSTAKRVLLWDTFK